FIGLVRYFFSVKTNINPYTKYIIINNYSPFADCVFSGKFINKNIYTNYYYRSESKNCSLHKGMLYFYSFSIIIFTY
ncbi:hypothetical protein B0H65DRAFT_422155, partial [Neurospora tetraspora]